MCALLTYTLNMKLFRNIILSARYLVLFIWCLVLSTSFVHAEGEFTTDVTVSYKVQDSGKTLVTHEVNLENNLSNVYATSYSLTLENIEAGEVKAFGANGSVYAIEENNDDQKTDIKVIFPDSVVGKGQKRHFFVSYENSKFAVRTGEVWEISIPRLEDLGSFRNYTVRLVIPNSFGLEAYLSPKPQDTSSDEYSKIYVFSKEDLQSSGISAGFGQFQVFSFNLAYHLENPLATGAQTQIALPPDTAFQKVYFDKISPVPDNITIDDDGNWLANYKLSPRQRVDVTVIGYVQIFASYRSFLKPDPKVLSDNLKESEFWQTQDPEIKNLAAELKTPEAIYNYVVNNLKYDFSRVQPNVQRLGAKKALENKEQAICMEFTDLFVALARSAGIPAREVNGFAYTENPQLQPLSLVADVLHAWPEYYDTQKEVWIPVDPTWAQTSGIDYFNKLDLRHFTFVVHGTNATRPYPPGSYKLGPNPQKDVFVSFGKLAGNRVGHPELTLVSKKTNIFLNSVYKVKVTNPGPSALYSLDVFVDYDDKSHLKRTIETLPPFSSYELEFEVPFSLLGKDTPDKVVVKSENSRIQIPTNKSQVIINSLVSIFAVFVLIILWVLIKLKKITFAPFLVKMQSLYDKIFRKTPKSTINP